MALEVTHQYLQEENSLAAFDGLCKCVFLLLSHEAVSSRLQPENLSYVSTYVNHISFKRLY